LGFIDLAKPAKRPGGFVNKALPFLVYRLFKRSVIQAWGLKSATVKTAIALFSLIKGSIKIIHQGGQ